MSKTAYSLLRSSQGIIYAGSENEIGYLGKDSIGRTAYISLMPLLNADQKEFGPVWNLLELDGEIFFCSNEQILAYKDGKFRSWKGSFHKPQLVNGKLLVRRVGEGLFYLDKNELKMIPGTEAFGPAEFKIAFFLPDSAKNNFLVFTRAKGVFRLKFDQDDPGSSRISQVNDKRFEPFKNTEPYDVTTLENKNIVVGSLNKGIFVFDRNFSLLQSIDVNDGANDDECRRLFLDRQGNLWVAYNNGISKIEISFPLKRWNIYSGLKGSVVKCAKLKSKLYVATSLGMMAYDGANKKFTMLEDLSFSCTDVLVHNNLLYAGTQRALFSYDGNSVKEILPVPVTRLAHSPARDNLLYIASGSDILEFDLKSGKTIREISSDLNSDISSMGFAGENKLVGSTRSSGLFVIDLLSGKTETIAGNPFFNPAYENFLSNDGGKLYISTEKGIFVIGEDLKFEPLVDLNIALKDFKIAHFAFNRDEIYLHGTDRQELKTKTVCYSLSGKPVKRNEALDRLEDDVVRSYFFDSSRVFFSTTSGIFILDKNRQLSNHVPRPYVSLLLRDGDTILCNIIQSANLGEFAYGENRMMFQFGSNDFSDETKLSFEYYLEGAESGFNSWSEANKASYENKKLHEGVYIFHLRAKNIFGEVSQDLSLTFSILPPWYRTGLAYFVYGLILLGLVFGIIRFNTYRLKAQNRKLEKTVEERTHTISLQKTELEHKNQEITDSINYAQKIQMALMASMRLLDKNLRSSGSHEHAQPLDYFLLYQPKDIVSGDFYWATELELLDKKYFLAVFADCTGHGVPGAFMSLLCIGFLNEIIKEKGIHDPARIFDELRNKIISTLNPDGNESERKDGMDAVLLAFCEQDNQLHFAAANNSFYLLRDGNLLVMKADKMPVGKYSDESMKPFTANTFELKKGDVIYAFTDGYADQFGGPKGKKFKYKQLENLFLEIHKLDCSQQKEILAKKFSEWKGAVEQVDDVLVAGIRF